MFAIKKIIASLLLPPGIFVSISFVSGIWFMSRKRWMKGFISCAIAVIIWVTSTVFFAEMLSRGIESEYSIPKSPQGDVIVLLGGGIYDGAADITGIGAPLPEMVSRIVTAVRLQKKLDIPVIISSGRVFETQKSTEAAVARRFLEDLGVPHNKIIEENSSRDTMENAKYTFEICSQYGFKRPILVTSALHMKRSVRSFEKTGIKVLPFPANFSTWRNKVNGWQDFLPTGFDRSASALHEYLGLLYYKLAY